MNPLHQLIACGQSYWLDNLTRAMITSGELAARVCDHGLRGITSNPSTFQNAIAQGSGYDVSIAELIEEGLEVHDIYERLVVDDVRNACDILRPVYDQEWRARHSHTRARLAGRHVEPLDISKRHRAEF